MHEMTVVAKELVKARYGDPAKYSYYAGCSTGGRQGWVGGPVLSRGLRWPGDRRCREPDDAQPGQHDLRQPDTEQGSASIIPAAKWTAYRKLVLEKCDASDGVKDGLLENPQACKVTPKDMLCRSGDNDSCLTSAQVASMTRMLAGMKNPRTGEQLRAGWPVGAIPAAFVTGPKPEDVAVDTFRILFNDANWDYHTMDFDKDIARADKLGSNTINAADPAEARQAVRSRRQDLLLPRLERPGDHAAVGID